MEIFKEKKENMKHLFLLLIVCCSCAYSGLDDDYSHIDPILKPYLDDFKKEAKSRKIELSLETIKLSFGVLHGPAGVTYYNINAIVIDSTTINWAKNPEEVVFHEFGHLLLHRGHDNGTMIETQNGNIVAKSIMSESASIKYSNDPIVKRPFYIEELFNPDTPKPIWAH